MRTFRREDLEAANRRWSDFSDEWAPFRREAAARGMIYPPQGSKWDQRDDESPSQRAILILAVRETPRSLTVAIRTSSSWNEVVGKVLTEQDHLRRQAELHELSAVAIDSPEQATEALRSIVTRLKEDTP